MLDPRDPQTLHTRAINRALPRGKFLKRQAVTLADLVDGLVLPALGIPLETLE